MSWQILKFWKLQCHIVECIKLAGKENNKKLAEKAKSLLDSALLMRDSDSDLYFFRGIVNYYLNKPIESIPDYEIAIDKAEDNMPVHFMARGLCYAQLKLFKEAIQDFSIAIQLNEKLSEAYFYRGRCAFLLDDSQLAFQDFQKMITNKHDDPSVHINAGNLLMLAGSVEDARKAYTNANSILTTPEAFIQRAKCYILLEKPENAQSDLENSTKLKDRKDIDFDIEILKIMNSSFDSSDMQGSVLKKLSQLSKALQLHTEGHIFKYKHLHWYKGVLYLHINEYHKAKTEFKASLDTKSSTEDSNSVKENLEILYNLALCYILTEQYESKLVKIHECHPVYIRPSINFPFIQLPSMDFFIEKPMLDNFTPKNVKCKPEAPWLNRVKGTIQFTEEIREIQSESVASTAKSESDEESNKSIFDSSFSNIKTFRSAVVLPSSAPVKPDTAEFFNFFVSKEKPGENIVIDTSESVIKKIDSACFPDLEND